MDQKQILKGYISVKPSFVLYSYLPVPTSPMEKGLLVLRCDGSLFFGLGFAGTTTRDSEFVGETGTNALESGTHHSQCRL